MTTSDSITISGQQYDPVTGLPIKGELSSSEKTESTEQPARAQHTPATHLHATPQRSVTLHRKSLKKPTHKIVGHRQTVRTMSDVHPGVRRFAPHPAGAVTAKPTVASTSAPTAHVAPVVHPFVAKAHAQSEAKAQSLNSSMPTASEKKNEALSNAVANTHKHKSHRQRIQPRQRVVAIFSATFAFVLLGGYFTYLNMPVISVRVAAAQAGIEAGYPNYRPDGYSLTGPVTFSDSRVSMNFKSNGGTQAFAINQSKSAWDNEAVLDNYVIPRAGSNYIPYAERGLTIYTFDDNAAWVNGGILYTIDGNAPLSSEQIRRIATSLL